jgi:hypothetical protein
MRAALRIRRLRSWLIPSTLLVLLLLALVPTDGMLVGTAVALFVLLTAAVVTHYRLEHRLPAPERRRGPALASPLDVAVALTVILAIGSLVAVVVALLLSAVLKVGGDGRSLLRILLAAFALAPCLSIGARCGRWWAFSGSVLLVPVAGICVLIVGPRSGAGMAEILFVVAATGLVVAVGSLERRLQSVAPRGRRFSRPDATSSTSRPARRRSSFRSRPPVSCSSGASSAGDRRRDRASA